ncbi:class I SAM-dependent DNA methyltransferase [Comamonas flocculans]|uniref:site-specific DNA-methyltransferase (adenine-specific) n=1 Tax=Comamonas flocculans TaxID=2597701 RepID=A0A5B8RUC0_9BURK|nr:DNA methyltransferase [Comamonas flocculans]QEA12693.1 class I SAM-dependent DNA methyltransferase [Comamonas flocculans]
MTPADFIAQWGPGGASAHLNEEQGAQSHFLGLCELLGVPKPGSPEVADEYLFERRSRVIGEARGYADVYYRDHFAWENKAPGKNLDAALRQLLQYSLALSNPPLLVVCDRLVIRIHTQFTGHPSETHTIRIEELADPAVRELLRRVWSDPESFRPRLTSRDITEEAARSFATLAEQLRARGHGADAVAHFLTQCLFCFFAEDVGLLPARMFERLVGNRQLTSERLTQGLASLFTTMQTGGLYGADDIPWFNGGLFARIDVPKLEIVDITELRKAASLNWSAIDVSIFGTLFERGLDPAKRSQLGAHYTDPATIARITEPVITRPLLQEWALVAQDLSQLAAKIRKNGDAAYKKTHQRFVQWLERLRAYRILDPACGSGNFLFMGLKALKDVELHAITEAARLGLDREQDLVTGVHNLLGIELNDYAAELARVSVWIGEIQWRIAHGYGAKTNPVLEPLEQIECRDALLTWPLPPLGEGRDGGQPTPIEAAWPRADVVVGNPPFLGDRKMIRELGEAYTFALRKTYEGRVPGGADLVCYWFEKARAAMAGQALNAAGFVATNSIRGGANRKVLDAIVRDSRIFEAWSDEPWVNEGAAVRVSLVAFGHFSQAATLNGDQVPAIASDLTNLSHPESDLTHATRLRENADASFIGTQKNGPFDVPGDVARAWLALPNPHGQSNAIVVRPWANGLDITRRPQDRWVIDFGVDMPQDQAALFETPFQHVLTHVKPTRVNVRRDWHRTNWWLFGDSRPGLRKLAANIERLIVTPMVAKHRLFAWLPACQIPENLCVAIARADDTTFGILHSRMHELWSLRMGTSLEDRPRYTPTTCFETFPFPVGLAPADTAHQRTEPIEGGALIPADLPEVPFENFKPNQPPALASQAQPAINSKSPATAPATLREHACAIACAAHRLDALRRNWLNPPEWTQGLPEVVPLGMSTSPYPDRMAPRPGLSEADAKALKARTLTKLYNLRPAWLAQAHAQLDAAVAAVYGWTDWRNDMPDEDILRRLLALNRQRTQTESAP